MWRLQCAGITDINKLESTIKLKRDRSNDRIVYLTITVEVSEW